jgi:hypothetical protein
MNYRLVEKTTNQNSIETKRLALLIISPGCFIYLGHAASNFTIICEWPIRRCVEGSDREQLLSYYAGICLGG